MALTESMSEWPGPNSCRDFPNVLRLSSRRTVGGELRGEELLLPRDCDAERRERRTCSIQGSSSQ